MTRDKLAKQISSNLERTFSRKNMIFICPLSPILKGLCLERSASDKEKFYLSSVIMPLCVPEKYVYFAFAGREKPSRRWELNSANLMLNILPVIQNDIFPRLYKVNSPSDAINDIEKYTTFPLTIHAQQAVAYLSVLAGNNERAGYELSSLIERLDNLDNKLEWQDEILIRAKMLMKLFLSNHATALHQLRIWENETIKNLGLENACKTMEQLSIETVDNTNQTLH